MIIAIDIGNTHTDIGVVDLTARVCRERTTFVSSEIEIHLVPVIRGLMYKYHEQLKAIAASSVIRSARFKVNGICADIKAPSPIWVEYSPELPVKITYEDPTVLGADRIANLMYGFVMRPRTPTVIVDAGTTVTIDLLSAAGEFCGGIIVPGVITQLKSLHTHTAQLPKLSLENIQAKFPGTSTSRCMVAGACASVAGAINVAVKRFEQICNCDCTVFATGGTFKYTADFLECSYEYVPDLTILGVAFCANHSTNNSVC